MRLREISTHKYSEKYDDDRNSMRKSNTHTIYFNVQSMPQRPDFLFRYEIFQCILHNNQKKIFARFCKFLFYVVSLCRLYEDQGESSLDFLEREIYGEFSMKFSLLRISLGKFCISFLNRKIVSHCLGEKAFPSDKKAPTHEAFLFLFLFLFRWK